MATDNDNKTQTETASTPRDSISVRLSSATMDAINEFRRLISTRVVEGITPEHAASLMDQVSPDRIIGVALRETLMRSKNPPQPERFSAMAEAQISKVQASEQCDRHSAIEEICVHHMTRDMHMLAPELGSPTDVAVRSFHKDMKVPVPAKSAAKGKGKR